MVRHEGEKQKGCIMLYFFAIVKEVCLIVFKKYFVTATSYGKDLNNFDN